MSAITLAAAVAAAASLAAGCSTTPSGPPGTGESTRDSGSIPVVERPHFEGARTVVLAGGRPVYTEQACSVPPPPDRLCSTDGRQYLLLGEPRTARLVEARMDQTRGNTAWTVSVTFARASVQAVRSAREEARGTGAVVLVLDEARSTLLLRASVPQIERRRITYHAVDKPTAWALVAGVAEP